MDEELRENPPAKPDFDRLARSILADKPRVTRFPIAWTKDEPDMELPPVSGNPDDEPAEFEVGDNEIDNMMEDDDDGNDAQIDADEAEEAIEC